LEQPATAMEIRPRDARVRAVRDTALNPGRLI